MDVMSMVAEMKTQLARGQKVPVEDLIAKLMVIVMQQGEQIAELQKNLESLTGTVSDHTTFHPESGTYHGMDE